MGGRGGGGPWGSQRRWPVQVTEEAVRGGSRRTMEEQDRAHHGGRPHSEIQNLTGVFGFLSYEKIVYRHKT